MASVAPVRHHEPLCAVAVPRLLGGHHVLAHVLHAPAERVPRAGAWTDVEVESRLLELGRLLHERMVALVSPVESYHVLRQLAHEFRMLEYDVAPEHRTLPPLAREVGHLQEEVEIHAPFALLLHGGGAASVAPQVERLVAADVDEPRLEIRQQLAKQPVNELERCRISGTESGRILLEASPRKRRSALGQLGEMVVARLRQPPLHVSEAVLVRHELDAVHHAVEVQLAYLLGRERRRLLPHRLVRRVGERVFGVELELVVVEARKDVHQLLQRAHRGHLVAADVEHV